MGSKDHAALCEEAWAALERCIQLAGKTSRPKNKTPFAYVQETLDKLHALGSTAAAEACTCAGPDALTIARWLSDTLASMSLVLIVAEECIASDSENALLFMHVAAQRLEHRLLRLLDLLRGLRDRDRVRPCPPEELLSSGDLLVFWRDYFPRRFRVSSTEFLQVLRETRSVEAGSGEKLLPWLQLRSQEGELELVDLAIVLDNLGLSRGMTFCTHWEELCGHAFLTAALSQTGSGGSMSAADLVLARREQESSVLFTGLQRETLRSNCALLSSLMVLGAVIACDCEEGLIVQFQEPQIAFLLARQPALAEAMAAAAHGSNLGLGPPKAKTASACMAGLVQKNYQFQHAHERLQFLALLKAKKLWQLDDFLSVFEIQGARRRAVLEQRVRACDPTLQSEAWPKLQQSMRDQKAFEEQVLARKQQLQQMEHACDHPDQVAHIRALLQDVAEAEEEQERNKNWLEEQMKTWQDEDETFNQGRFHQDLVCRQRVASMLTDVYYRQQQRLALQAEIMRIESLLLDFDEAFATSRQKLHDYDQRLTAAIRDKEEFLASVMQALASVRSQMLEADEKAAEHHKQQQTLRRIMDLQAAKTHHLDEIDALEKRLDALRGKHTHPPPAVP